MSMASSKAEDSSPTTPPRSCRRHRCTGCSALVIITSLVVHNMIYGVEVAKWVGDSSASKGVGTEDPVSSSGNENEKNTTTASIEMDGGKAIAQKVTGMKEIPKLFHCEGYALNRNFRPVVESLFPEYQWRDVSTFSFDTLTSSNLNSWDIFVSNWAMNECPSLEIQQHLNTSFPGKVLFLNPEDITYQIPPKPQPNFFELGPGPPQANRVVFTFLQAVFWAQVDNKQAFFETSKRPQNTRKHFMIYANTRCFGIRQKAFRTIANLELGVSYFGGKCNGGMKNESKAKYYPNSIKLRNWEDNRKLFRDFRFCLTMEHSLWPGYITEKILVGFWAGCMPIYYGSTEIFDIFDRRSFIYYDIDDPQPALDRIKYLEQNRTAYDEAMKTPILTEGAVEKYFSLSDEIGGGKLKNRLRTLMRIQ